jgi:tetratricopeptide (TPR) repeat protein
MAESMFSSCNNKQTNKALSVTQMVSTIISTVEARQAKWREHSIKPTGPLFTFLIGSGFSITAGVPGVRHLVVALEKFRSNPELSWPTIFDATLETSYNDRGISGTDLTNYYFELMRDVLPLPPSRHDFITAAMQWSSSRKVQMNLEGILLAAVMMAGTGNDVPLNSSNVNRHWLSRAFSRHTFTTNFDDVMLTTFHYGNQPVEIIDAPGVRTITPAAEYPTLVYLHGRHLHFDIRNTPQELHTRYQEKNKTGDLFDQFRDLLRTTGLIVIGYSGAMDKVTETIKEAVEDPNSLPYGLWWAAYKDTSFLHKMAIDIIENTERAFYFDPGKDSEQIMRTLCNEIGIDEVATINEWSKKTKKVALEINNFLMRASFDIHQFRMTAYMALLSQSQEEIVPVLEEWDRIQSAALDHDDKEFVADLLSIVGKLMVISGKVYEGETTFQIARDLHDKTGREDKVANDLISIGEIYLLRGQIEEAQRKLSESMSIYNRIGSVLGVSTAYRLLGNVYLLKGDLRGAEINYEKALKISTDDQYELGIAHTLKSKGDLCIAKLGSADAAKCYENALDLHAKDGDTISRAMDIRGLGNAMLLNDRRDEAEKYFQEALLIDKQIDYRRGIAHDMGALAKVRIDQDNFAEAESLIKDSLNIFKNVTDIAGEFESIRLECICKMKKGDTAGARRCFDDINQRAERMGFVLNTTVFE